MSSSGRSSCPTTTTTAETSAGSVPCSATATTRPGRTNEREAHAQDHACERAAPLEQLKSRQTRPRLRHEERASRETVEARRLEVGSHIREAVLPRVEVEDQLARRVAGDPRQELAAVGRVVDGAESGVGSTGAGGA